MSDIVKVEDRLAVIKAVGNVCTFDMMDSMTHVCCGEKVIHEIASPRDTQYDIALASLDWADRIGIETNLISLIFQASESRTDQDNLDLRAVVSRVLSGKLVAAPAIAPGAANVVKALQQLRGAMGDDGLHASVSESEGDLKRIVDNVRSLTAYKQLHDILHSLQYISKRRLLNAGRDLADPERRETLQEFADSSLRASASGGAEVTKFEDAIATEVEKNWVKDLETAARKLEAGTHPPNAGAVRIAIYQISNIVDEHSPRLNQLIFAATKTLPLKKLSEALTGLGAPPALKPSIDKASLTVQNLSAVLTSRVTLHNRLQEAEKCLVMLAETLAHPDDMILPEFADAWPETKSAVSSFASYKIDYDTPPFDGRLIDAVDERLLALEAAMDLPDFASRFGRLAQDLETDFSAFHRKARLQFYELDKKLKANLEALGEISRSLQDILGDVGRHPR